MRSLYWDVEWKRKPLRAVGVKTDLGRSPKDCYEKVAKELGFTRKILNYREGKEGWKNDDLGMEFYWTNYEDWIAWFFVVEDSQEIFMYQYPFSQSDYYHYNGNWTLNEVIFINCILETFRHFWKNRKVVGDVIEGEVDWNDMYYKQVQKDLVGVHGFYIDTEGGRVDKDHFTSSVAQVKPMYILQSAKFFTTMIIRERVFK